MSKFIVDRKTWHRGTIMNSKLLNINNKMCCLGFVGSQCGIPDSYLMGKEYPSDLLGVVRGYPIWLQSDRKSHQCAIINDDDLIGDDVREAKLSAIFAANGDELEFVG